MQRGSSSEGARVDRCWAREPGLANLHQAVLKSPFCDIALAKKFLLLTTTTSTTNKKKKKKNKNKNDDEIAFC